MAKCTIYKNKDGQFVTIYNHERTTTGVERKPETWTPIAEYEASCFKEKYGKKKDFLRQLAKGMIDEFEFKLLNEVT